MNVRVPAFAPAMPPETGESTKRKPRAADASWQNREVSTSTVDVSSSSARARCGRPDAALAAEDLAHVLAARQRREHGVGARHRLGDGRPRPARHEPRRPSGTRGRDRPRGRRAPPRPGCPTIGPPMCPSPIQAMVAMAPPDLIDAELASSVVGRTRPAPALPTIRSRHPTGNGCRGPGPAPRRPSEPYDLPGRGAAQNRMTCRIAAPAASVSMASLTSSSAMCDEISASTGRRPCRHSSA